MKSPADITLPFFAYGLFRSDQPAFKQIEPFVSKQPNAIMINDCALRIRNGVPLLYNSLEQKMNIPGEIIYFHSERVKEAYDTISQFAGFDEYTWHTLHLDTKIDVNTLWGVYPENGSRYYSLGHPWSVKNDPIFTDGFELIKETIKEVETKKANLHKNLLKLNMAYLLLWTAIERYCQFYYGLGTGTEKINNLAQDPIFQSELKKCIGDNDKNRVIHRSSDPTRRFTLDANKPGFSLGYYYTIRNNITHRGKGDDEDFEIIRTSIKELHEIFGNVFKINGFKD